MRDANGPKIGPGCYREIWMDHTVMNVELCRHILGVRPRYEAKPECDEGVQDQLHSSSWTRIRLPSGDKRVVTFF